MVDKDLLSIQEVRALVRAARKAQPEFAQMSQERVDAVIKAVAEANAQAIERVAAAIRQPGGEQAVQLKVAEKAVDAYGKVAADATTTLIAAAARADGARVFAEGTYVDDAATLAEALNEQLIRADLVVVVGGLDGAVPQVLADLGEVNLHRVTINPGGTQAYGPDIFMPDGPVSAVL